MRDTTALGDFLRTRRGRLTPEDVGITSYGARRVPGLRREELAQLAGVSVTYYTRLEQGQSHQASPSVIDALADALRLSDAERAYLHTLVWPVPSRPRRPARPATARPGTRRLLDALGDVPAIVIGTRTEVLAWNTLGHLLLAGHLDPGSPGRPADRPNLTRMLFLDPHHRDLHPRWESSAACAVASLRITAGRDKDDRQLAELIGELSVRSPEFAALWSRHPVANHAYGTRQLRHPEVGELSLELETLGLSDGSGQRVLMYSAPTGSLSHTALRLLRMRPTATRRDSASAASTR
ncbi:helix-turn-helix transcriptional regulator [Nonomuraea sp. SBT364]|uniref:helix-turn-helix transcriptional regulator n=1 Tax=Nonomuraea sp. SBT364 TaxID=1580530 RepID=UPI00066BBA5E|nr:helix-turn-helix transcriptional regulator [Nonomuraea sp. SBT364]